MASIIVAQLLFLENQGSNKPIHIYINSPGGGKACQLMGLNIDRCNIYMRLLDDREKIARELITNPHLVVTSGLAIYDTMQYIQSPVSTLCLGQACSMASLLLAAGSPVCIILRNSGLSCKH